METTVILTSMFIPLEYFWMKQFRYKQLYN